MGTSNWMSFNKNPEKHPLTTPVLPVKSSHPFTEQIVTEDTVAFPCPPAPSLLVATVPASSSGDRPTSLPEVWGPAPPPMPAVDTEHSIYWPQAWAGDAQVTLAGL